MREILFRGKSVNNGEWVEGFLVIDTIFCEDAAPVKHYHIDEMNLGTFPVEFQSGISETVAPDTVGQFTELTDKNGIKIFDGDIVKHYNRSDDPASFDIGQIVWNSAKCRWSRTSEKCNYLLEVWSSSCKDYEVIGNIHDNPELVG